MLTLTFFVALVVLALAVGLTPLAGWTKPAVWLAAALLLSLLVALKVLVLRALVPIALLGTLALSGCCTTGTKLENGQCFTVKALKMQEKADRALLPETQRLCAAAVDKCGKVTPDKCPAFGKCATILTGYKVGMNAAGRSLESVHKLLEDLKTLEVK